MEPLGIKPVRDLNPVIDMSVVVIRPMYLMGIAADCFLGVGCFRSCVTPKPS